MDRTYKLFYNLFRHSTKHNYTNYIFKYNFQKNLPIAFLYFSKNNHIKIIKQIQTQHLKNNTKCNLILNNYFKKLI